MKPAHVRLCISAALTIFAFCIAIASSQIALPSCGDQKVMDFAITLWKLNALKGNENLQDGRLSQAVQEPVSVSNGRACSADLVIDGRPSGTLSYSIFRPMGGDAGMVTIE